MKESEVFLSYLCVKRRIRGRGNILCFRNILKIVIYYSVRMWPHSDRTKLSMLFNNIECQVLGHSTQKLQCRALLEGVDQGSETLVAVFVSLPSFWTWVSRSESFKLAFGGCLLRFETVDSLPYSGMMACHDRGKPPMPPFLRIIGSLLSTQSALVHVPQCDRKPRSPALPIWSQPYYVVFLEIRHYSSASSGKISSSASK